MRIVAGQFGGRRLLVPKGQDIRPTSDKVRGAVFNMLRGYGAVQDAHVLDAFCGTGALGLEALSQGALEVTFVDKSRESLALARQNAEAIGVQEVCAFLNKDAKDIGIRKEGVSPFDLVFMDPPYRKSLIPKCLEILVNQDWIRDGAIFVLEAEKEFRYGSFGGFELLKEKIYGDTRVILLRYEKGS